MSTEPRVITTLWDLLFYLLFFAFSIPYVFGQILSIPFYLIDELMDYKDREDSERINRDLNRCRKRHGRPRRTDDK
jgi:hypothetical protein